MEIVERDEAVLALSSQTVMQAPARSAATRRRR